ncbi:MAG: L-asparaginase [Vicingaceae bacterium]|jgi:L-asparaginase
MIHIITTGGTIEGLEYDRPENRSNNPTVCISDFLKTASVSFQYTIETAFQKDSRFITLEDRMDLAEKIATTDCNKILITHGTFTMAETAKFLGRLGLDKTIVLVGSFILGTEEETDAPFNLGYALGVIDFLEKGVYVAMNGSIFSWDNVKKNLETNRFEKEH